MGATNVQDAMNAMETALSASDAYSPATPSHWAGTPPTTMGEALDRLAAYANQPSLLALIGVGKP